MERRKAITAAAAASLTLLAGAAGIALNSGIVGADDNDGVGNLSPLGSPARPPVTVIIDEPAPADGAASTGGSATPRAPGQVVRGTADVPVVTFPTAAPGPVAVEDSPEVPSDGDDVEAVAEDEPEHESEYESDYEDEEGEDEEGEDEDHEDEDHDEEDEEHEDEDEHEFEGADDDD
jgi:hypothetical protein